MTKGRLEAFSDGVIAIIITIMVLEIKVPHGSDLMALKPLIPVVISYVLSFIYIGIYWNNHHHMLHAAERIDGSVLWANLYLLFWLSLIPFVTAWMGENHFAPVTMMMYGFIMLMCALAYYILQTRIIAKNGKDSKLSQALGADFKGKASLVLYTLAIGAAFIHEWISAAIYVLVAVMWLIPDKRIEKVIDN
ncbi:TMEM175 family protein [Solitalea canadensis]|uniref:Putative integral membrane protein n=1 Tax=Solitalea canadensis (strain ATCC 29591 / DSM 3403 / JCM 21819 / LMG 8368 / NBRC 15130 / NCIMB 12057 / USAM 9D) TaxID=929556 RepID=H8KPC1_SOLCM|nr:TMEM175 family protein [Solitalea canadensis]AFD05819.1 putative integral membrane protein [Solitalea canadensis DSM 3403]